MRIVVREVDRLNKLITNFLEFSRPRALDMADADLIELSREVLGLFNNNKSCDPVQVDLRCADSAGEELAEAPARVDREAFRQVLWNLLNNAREAMSQTDAPHRIIVSVAPRAAADEPDDGRPPEDAAWLIAIEDDGPGIAPEVAERIFEPFFTTKETGTGLGLATIHRLIEQHHGRIHVGPAEELRGARFEIELPT
jgi:two-component system sensor histidine kinase PilS (NtrC family)